jgi:N-acetylneuraminic acid mutarotase
LAAGVIGGKLYAIVGRVDGSHAKHLTVNEEYDPALNRWRKRTPMPTRRSGIAAAALGGKIYVFGGEANWRTLNLTEIYGPGSDAWSKEAVMPTARHGFGVAILGQEIYVVSGGPKAGANILIGQ